MKKKKLLTIILIAALISGELVSVIPAYAGELGINEENTEATETQDAVSTPYGDVITDILDEQTSLKLQRENCDSNYEDMRGVANQQISELETISKHLDEQYEKYSDYDKLAEAKKDMDRQLSEAKSIFMSTNGAYTTNEYKYNVEIAPDDITVGEVEQSFEQISEIYNDAKNDDMTVKKFRGFYDIGDQRENIVKTAMDAVGKIRYQWGAKSVSEDMPSSLDCSGFVQWVYRVVNKEVDDTLSSTASIGTTYEQIQKEELKPGDIGMKNPEGTCVFDAHGDVFYSEESAKSSNEEFNQKIKKAIKEEKSDYEDAVKKENTRYKKEKKAVKNQDSKESADKESAKVNEKKKDKSGKKKDKTGSEDTKDAANLSLDEIREKHEKKLEQLDKKKDKAVKELKEELVKEDDITHQTGHVGIYAGKDENGNDTWIHCTGGSIDNVVMTTEDEYNGFQYYYSPIENKKKSAELGGTKVINLPNLKGYNGGKTYESYEAITSQTSLQYKLQQKAYTNEDGFRMVNGRYMIAVGSGVSHDIGRYVDLVLENGTVIPCIIGDAKADKHTDNHFHIMTVHSHCVSEFMVDTSVMGKNLMSTGNMSNYKEEWNSKVVKFILYDKRV